MPLRNTRFENFKIGISKNDKKKTLNILNRLIKKKSEVILSLTNNYKSSYKKNLLNKLKKFKKICLIGMGGSSLGVKAIYSFLLPKKKQFEFIDNFSNIKKKNEKKLLLIISKSGNTLETISNSNILINKKNQNIFLTENKKSYLIDLAHKLKSEVIHHNNYIGGRYSVLSEVGMLPAELMGFKPDRFRRLNSLISNKKFLNTLIENVSSIYNLSKKKITNSIILNYDERSNNFFLWYQQLVAESLGKKNKGIMPFLSVMPKDNHSLMQYYLEGVQNNFFTFFFVKDKNSPKIKNHNLLKQFSYLKDKNINDISFSQFLATKSVFKAKKISYRSFEIRNRSEETLGELFIFFILETILLGNLMNVNPFDQPSVELIKKKTSKILISK